MIVNSTAHLLLLALMLFLNDISAANPPPYSSDLAGQYCEARKSLKCCSGREDDCSVPILGTLCYCDDFCNRTRNDDCCPDFWTFCKSLSIPMSIIDRREQKCERHGRFYADGETVKLNCNLCRCQDVSGRMEMLCENKLCLVDEEIIERVNKHRNYGWRASNYSTFWGRYYDEGLSYRLGTIHFKKKVAQMLPINPIYDPSSLPREFDARTKWPGKISEPRDQGWCGASWVFSTVAVASDRFAIALDRFAAKSNLFDWNYNKDKLFLSPQQLLNCNRNQQGCKGGYLTRAWNFISKFGLVSESCYPWNSNIKTCQVKKFSAQTEATCPAASLYSRSPSKGELHRVAPPYRLSGEHDIMYEILESGPGPVQATMRIMRDFFSYSGGIYKCLNFSRNDRSGFHSVRIVGWGEEYQNNQLVKYWNVSNSWGKWWGEGGYFRIRRGSNECQIEEFVLAALPNIQSLNLVSKVQTQPLLDYNMEDLTNLI